MQRMSVIRQFNHSSEGELAEFCNAVIDTLETEGIVGLKAGIGMEVFDVQGLRDSYLQGLDALALGRKYFSREPVYVYHHQTLERIIDCIPPEKQREIRQQALRNRTYGKLSDEMLETVRVFFQNDLNLTAASRQLFIHRNTLNYRLDKIRKETGLDLRLFRDAVVFCVISALRDEIDG